MKHLKKYEMWSTPSVTDDIIVNYGDKTPELSDIVIEIIKYIEDNYSKISTDILNDTTEFCVGFNFGSVENVMKYDKIRLEEYKNQKYLHLYYAGNNGYTIDVTDYEYEYLHDYFLKIHKEFRKKDQEKNKERHKQILSRMQEEIIKKKANKFNL